MTRQMVGLEDLEFNTLLQGEKDKLDEKFDYQQ